MAIAYDNTWLSRKPVRWEMQRVLSVSSILGFLAILESFGLLLIGKEAFHLNTPQLQTLIFLQLVAGGHLMLFLTRTKKAFWHPPYPSWQLFWAIVGTQVLAVLMTGFGWLVPALAWKVVGLVWGYNLVWMVIQDGIKLGVYRLIENRSGHHRNFLKTMNQPLH
jgi:H+-transporting ATPase